MPTALNTTPVEVDYASYFSPEANRRSRGKLRGLQKYMKPGVISFGGGLPHASTWPVNALTVSVPFSKKSVFVPGYETPTPDDMYPLEPYTAPGKTDLAPDLTNDLQYTMNYGIPYWREFFTEHVRRMHNPPYADWAVHMSNGCADGTQGALTTLVSYGDTVLVEEFAFPGLLTQIQCVGGKPQGVPMDEHGVSDTALDELMSSWDEEQGPRPKFIFIVPTCSNPCGVTMPVWRKQDLYAVCRKWNLLIVEDDPYCYLQIRPNGAASPPVPSFLSIDVDARVLRLDSMSKIVAPGSRLGFITGPRPLLERVMLGKEAMGANPSGLSVAVVASVLRAWGGHEGFENNYLPHISSIYSDRCLAMVKWFEQYLPSEACAIPAPSGGMFLWLRLKVESHPQYADKTLPELEEQIFTSMIDEGVITAPSSFFKVPGKEWTKEEEAQRMFLRLSFTKETFEVMEEGVRRMGKALRKEWQLA